MNIYQLILGFIIGSFIYDLFRCIIKISLMKYEARMLRNLVKNNPDLSLQIKEDNNVKPSQYH